MKIVKKFFRVLNILILIVGYTTILLYVALDLPRSSVDSLQSHFELKENQDLEISLCNSKYRYVVFSDIINTNANNIFYSSDIQIIYKVDINGKENILNSPFLLSPSYGVIGNRTFLFHGECFKGTVSMGGFIPASAVSARFIIKIDDISTIYSKKSEHAFQSQWFDLEE